MKCLPFYATSNSAVHSTFSAVWFTVGGKKACREFGWMQVLSASLQCYLHQRILYFGASGVASLVSCNWCIVTALSSAHSACREWKSFSRSLSKRKLHLSIASLPFTCQPFICEAPIDVRKSAAVASGRRICRDPDLKCSQ